MIPRFGIPTLDELIQIPEPKRGNKKSTGDCATSFAILGPDGSGKSIFALHMASRYLADCVAELGRKSRRGSLPQVLLPQVLYVSSDFTHGSANSVWQEFGLDQPNRRQIPFARPPFEIERWLANPNKVTLQRVTPGESRSEDAQEASDFLLRDREDPQNPLSVGFIDVARFTAGDDWHFTNSVLAKLPNFETFTVDDGAVPHLMIIDSVAGFETYIGEKDAFGLDQTRRSRIAQSLRNVGVHCHLVFVVEEPKELERLPEEYVTDVVLRLRTRRLDGSAIRTVEVEKARGRNHAHGEHPFEIRSRTGSSTGRWENPDMPRSKNAYVQVFHSLAHLSLLEGMEHSKGKSNPKQTVAPFGIPYLDRMLSKGVGVPNEFDQTGPIKVYGLKSSMPSGLIGENSTGKSSLGEKFIAEGLRTSLEDALALYAAITDKTGERLKNKVVRRSCQRILTRIGMPTVSGLSNDDEQPPPLKQSRVPGAIGDLAEKIRKQWEVCNSESGRRLLKLFKKSEEMNPVFSRSKPNDAASLKRREEARRELREFRGGSVDPISHAGEPLSRFDFAPDLEPPTFSARTPDDFVRSVFRHPNLRFPGILLATGDRTTASLADRCLGLLWEGLQARMQKLNLQENEEIKRLLQRILVEQLIVRRFDVAAVTAPELYHVIQRAVLEAQHMIHGHAIPHGKSNRFSRADRIRLVIDDLKVLASLCPEILGDSAFLPFLNLFLEREGATSLIILTESARPFVRPTDPLASVLQPLLKHAVLTWGVPFRGRNRIAISAVPPSHDENSGIVRELKLQPDPSVRGDEQLRSGPQVSRNFELYSGVETGEPTMVPLAVFIYAATDGFQRFIDQEDLMFREHFRGLPDGYRGEVGRVLWPIDASQYYAIRDLTHLPWDVMADAAIIDHVDSFWSLEAESGSLSSLRDYLMADDEASQEDTFGLFNGEPKSQRHKTKDEGITHQEGWAGKRRQRRLFGDN